MRIRSIALAVCCLTTFGFGAAQAQITTGPRPVTMVVPFAPGGGYDRLARIVAPRLAEVLGQPVVVDNRAGANGTVGMAYAARAPADGRTLVVIGVGDVAISPFLTTNLTYDTTRDFIPVALLAKYTMAVAVGPHLPVKSVQELVALAKSRPGAITYASSSANSASRFATEIFQTAAGVKMLHVPYKGVTPALTDLAGGHVDITFAELGSAVAMASTGKIRLLAVTADTRAKAFPDVPTLREAGVPNMQVVGWWGVMVPAGTPAPIVTQLNREISTIMNTPAVRSQIEAFSAEVATLAPDQLATLIRQDIAQFGKAIKDAGIKPE